MGGILNQSLASTTCLSTIDQPPWRYPLDFDEVWKAMS